jgi:hypothetical protein
MKMQHENVLLVRHAELIFVGISELGWATRKRQVAKSNGKELSRIVWMINDRASLVKAVRDAIAQVDGDSEADTFKANQSRLADSQLINGIRQMPDETLEALWESLIEIEPRLLGMEKRPEAWQEQLLSTAMNIVDERTAIAATSLWSDLPKDQKMWLWSRLPTSTKDLISTAKGLMSAEDLADVAKLIEEAEGEGILFYKPLSEAHKKQVWAKLTMNTRDCLMDAIAASRTEPKTNAGSGTGGTTVPSGAMTVRRALTVHEPWASAIASGAKLIENRSWPCPLKLGDWIAIHAGKTLDKDGAEWIAENIPSYQAVPVKQGIIAIARFDRNIKQSDSPWFVGPIGWEFSEVIALPKPIECRGQQGLWTIPDTVCLRIGEAIAPVPKTEKQQPQLANLSAVPDWMNQLNFVYIGREMPKHGLERSPLSNPHKISRERDRDQACDAYIDLLISALRSESGPMWQELQRLAKLQAKGALTLGCWCAPKRCHGESILFVLEGLARGEYVDAIASELESGKSPQQALL